MGNEYTAILMDEGNFNYYRYSRADILFMVLRDLHAEGYPDVRIIADVPYMVMLDMGRAWPENHKVKAILRKYSDSVFYMTDNECYLRKVED